MNLFSTQTFPLSRVATRDTYTIGKQKHHVVALVEADITLARELLTQQKQAKRKISFTAWLIKVISLTVKKHPMSAAFLNGRRSAICFEDINVSVLVEKDFDGQKVPLPLVIEKANEKEIEDITREIGMARGQSITNKDVVLMKKSTRWEGVYYQLPGFLRRLVWKVILRNPKYAFSKMGNVAYTSVGMIGSNTGWFIPVSVHPICFAISAIQKKPVVVNDQMVIREIIPITILFDHDVIDGANMARFTRDLISGLEEASGLKL